MILLKRFFLFLAGALLLTILIVGGIAFFKPSILIEVLNPDINAKIHRLNTMNEQTASLDVELTLQNKTPIPLNVKDIYFVVNMDGKQIIKSAKPFAIKIKPFAKSKIILPTEMQLAELKKTAAEFNPAAPDSAKYTVAIHYNMTTFLGIGDSSTVVQQFYHQKMGLPGARIRNVEVIESTLKKQRIRVNLDLVNPNPNEIRMKNPRFTVDFNHKKDFIKGSLGKTMILKASALTPKSIEVEIENSKIFNIIGGIIGKGGKLPLKLAFYGNLVSDSDILKECEVKLEVEGDLKSLIQSQKDKKK